MPSVEAEAVDRPGPALNSWPGATENGTKPRFRTAPASVQIARLTRAADQAAHPLRQWATAWARDCVRLSLLDGVSPATVVRRAVVHVLARGAAVAVVGVVAWAAPGEVPTRVAVVASAAYAAVVVRPPRGVPAARRAAR